MNMSTLMIDARCVSTGIGTYTINIVRGMNKCAFSFSTADSF